MYIPILVDSCFYNHHGLTVTKRIGPILPTSLNILTNSAFHSYPFLFLFVLISTIFTTDSANKCYTRNHVAHSIISCFPTHLLYVIVFGHFQGFATFLIHFSISSYPPAYMLYLTVSLFSPFSEQTSTHFSKRPCSIFVFHILSSEMVNSAHLPAVLVYARFHRFPSLWLLLRQNNIHQCQPMSKQIDMN